MTATLDAPSVVTITIARQALRAALTRLAGAVGSGTRALPVAQHIKLEVRPGSLVLTATDFEAWAELTIPCDASGEAVALLPARRLLEIVAALPPTPTVTLTLAERGGTITAARARFDITGLGVEEFPNAPDPVADGAEATGVNAAAFLDAIERAVLHCSTAESRPAINVVRLETFGSELHVIAVDEPRMVRLSVAASRAPLSACSVFRLSVPMLARLFGGLPDDATLSLTADHSRLFVESADARCVVRLVDMSFPNYLPIIAGRAPARTVVCDRLALIATIRRVALVANAARRIDFDLADEITVRAAEVDVGTGVDVVAIEEQRGETDRERRRFALSASFALIALETFTEPSVAIGFQSPSHGIVFRPASLAPSDPTFALVQPLRIL
jgi:DNA polymerase III sliding clamp (beta) subunit (PCNA family)